MTTSLRALLLLALLSLLVACGTEQAGDGAADVSADPDVAVDVLVPDLLQPDPDLTGADAEPSDPGGPPDAPDAAVDATPEADADTLPEGPVAWVYPHDPVTDGGQTSIRPILHRTDPMGRLGGEFSIVYNCLNSDLGRTINYAGGSAITLCYPKQTVEPGDDGTYLHVEPPAKDTDQEDPFAEVQMYVHMNEIHDYFAGVHGITHMNFPLVGLVNLTMKQYGQWTAFDNAAFMPRETMAAMGLEFGLDSDAIVFGQGTFIDFSYDASVIYHEYTHAVIGDERLLGNAADVYGLNPEPMAINEASADYFAATRIGFPQIGAYALDMPYMGDQSRNLDEFRSCPEDMIGESHHDGRMWSSGLWAIREALGAEVADRIIFRALLEAGLSTTFHEAAQSLLASAALEGADAEAAVRQALTERNLAACERVKPFEDLASVAYDEPLWVMGTMTAQVPEFQKAKLVPMAFQYVAEVPEGAASVRLSFKARVSDQMAQYWQGPIDVQVAFRAEQAVAYTYAAGKMQMFADALLTPTNLGGNKYQIDLAGSCVQPGLLYIHFMNGTMVDIQLDAMSLTFDPDVGDLPLNFDGCE